MRDDEVAAELLERASQDQHARRNAPGGRWTEEERAHARAVDTANTRWLAELVDTRGWPRIDQVGAKAAHAAFLLAQHADADPERQRRFLALMSEAVSDGQARPSELAFLEDRCRCNADQPQIYGTQVTTAPNGEIIPLPLADPDGVDDRRAAAGLETLAEYLEQVREYNR